MSAMDSSLELSADQARALERLMAWLKRPVGQSITLGGYAGTGKTMLASVLRREIRRIDPTRRVAFAAFTGKASQVLRTHLLSQDALYDGDTCGTIHSLLYSPDLDKEGRVIGWNRSKNIEADLLIIDEASMVTDRIWMDLLIGQKPIIALGDHGQLPPIQGSFNLMNKPDIVLEEIHRQVAGHPIIALAQEARTTGRILPGDYGDGVRKFSYATHDAGDINGVIDHLFENFHDDMLVLCGRNKTRVDLNRAIRQKMGRESDEPEYGDKAVCLKNSYAQSLPIYNGMVGTIASISPERQHWYDACIEFPDEERTFEGLICKAQFNHPSLIEDLPGLNFKELGERFDFGYALTVHKAQGSQAKTVVLFEERFIKSDDEAWRRWLYTAVTRAKENLYIIGPN